MPNCSSISGTRSARNSSRAADHEDTPPASTRVWQALICAAVLSVWQWGYDLHASIPWLIPDLLDPYFVSKPSEIFQQALVLSCIKSKLGVFNGWFNGDFAKCMARNEKQSWVATASR